VCEDILSTEVVSFAQMFLNEGRFTLYGTTRHDTTETIVHSHEPTADSLLFELTNKEYVLS
jgi:hypothetical protein